MKKIKGFLIFMVAAVLMLSCKGNLDIPYEKNGVDNTFTPYATETELNENTLLTFNTCDNFYAIHDNGTDGKGLFYEKSNQIYQLWSAHVEKK